MEGRGAGTDWEVWVRELSKDIVAPAAPAELHGIRSLQVPEPLKKVNPDAYKPHFLYLGFLNRPDDPRHQIALHRLKVCWARQCLAWMKTSTRERGDEIQTAEGQSEDDQWNTFVRRLNIDVQHAHAMYDIQPALPAEVVTNVLALDAVFVCLFLFHRYGFGFGIDRTSFSQFFGAGKVVRWEDCGSGASRANLGRDMILLENQLPLYILINVFKMLRLPSYIIISHFVRGMYRYILAIDSAHQMEDLENSVKKCFAHDNDAGDLVLNETSPSNHHLLLYLLKLVCWAPHATGDDSDGDDSDGSKYQEESGSAATLSPATLLHRHGIHFSIGSSGGTHILHLLN